MSGTNLEVYNLYIVIKSVMLLNISFIYCHFLVRWKRDVVMDSHALTLTSMGMDALRQMALTKWCAAAQGKNGMSLKPVSRDENCLYSAFYHNST